MQISHESTFKMHKLWQENRLHVVCVALPYISHDLAATIAQTVKRVIYVIENAYKQIWKIRKILQIHQKFVL